FEITGNKMKEYDITMQNIYYINKKGFIIGQIQEQENLYYRHLSERQASSSGSGWQQ
ncbi:MAG: hypothetical protein FE78DRAFT_139170, partial [Acidomyces sp. 'richmondensis']